MRQKQTIPSKKQGEIDNKPPTHRRFILKFVLFSSIVALVIFYTDVKGYFNPDYTNDHTRRKWNAYYEFTKKNPVDVVLVGNSHLYTGVSPEHLSNTLGANCFILASPGTTMTDTYYSLKEAIKVRKPKLAVVETFTLNDYDSHDLAPGTLSEQFKSFSARKDFFIKLASTPVLFNSDHYTAAWSNTIRNHSFIFTDTAQIRRNRTLSKIKALPERSLYLGRFIRFTSGIEDSTLVKYEREGFKAYEYSKHMPGEEALLFLRKTIQLCKENDVKLVFLTLPMYYKHVHDYVGFKDIVGQIIDGDAPWIDMQLPYDTLAFNPECFENTVAENQHMTYYGSLVAAYKLAGYIQQVFPAAVPDRSKDNRWKQLFYGSDGYFENHSPESDGVSKVLLSNSNLENGTKIKELIYVPSQGAARLLLKVERQDSLASTAIKALVSLEVEVDNKTLNIPMELIQSPAIQPAGHSVFMSEYFDPRVVVKRVNGVMIK